MRSTAGFCTNGKKGFFPLGQVVLMADKFSVDGAVVLVSRIFSGIF